MCAFRKNYLITGASGLIGAALVECLISRRSLVGDVDKIFASSRNPRKLDAMFGDSVDAIAYDVLYPNLLDIDADVIIHAASPASPELFTSMPIETIMSNIIGVRELLEYSSRKQGRKCLFVSSSEVYGKACPSERGFSETDYGYIDILNVRSSYPMGKRAAEAICIAYAKERDVNVSIVRPGHIYGPTASPQDNRVSSAFAWSAARGETLVLKSDGASLRSYTHAEDCASAIMTVIEKGKSCEAYNIANRAGVCSIRQMAEIMAEEGGVELRFEYAKNAEKDRFNPMNNSCLNPAKLESLGWRGEIAYEEGFRSTVRAIRSKLKQA